MSFLDRARTFFNAMHYDNRRRLQGWQRGKSGAARGARSDAGDREQREVIAFLGERASYTLARPRPVVALRGSIALNALNALTVIRSRLMLWAALSIGGDTLAPDSEYPLRHREIP
jgi:hypothetical protein